MLLDATATKVHKAMVRSVLHLCQCTRYDVCYAVKQLPRECRKPAQVLSYLRRHPGPVHHLQEGMVSDAPLFRWIF